MSAHKQVPLIHPILRCQDIPAQVTRARLVLDRSSWTNKNGLLQVQLWISLDGGSTYVPSGGGTAEGGELVGVNGEKMAETWWIWSIPAEEKTPRCAECVLVAYREPVVLSAKLEFL